MTRKFDGNAWVNEIVTGAMVGVLGAFAANLFVPDVSLWLTVANYGITGLLGGAICEPIRYGLNRLRGPNDSNDE